ncbi:hypothetical protein [Pandoraea sputorum]|uniref:hypothetical protein n=1 Tax=Pandoraea sputorum TaxID=93222 RepID=UPI0012429885|nr:hypothetical protein [Pandoraea sputorum]
MGTRVPGGEIVGTLLTSDANTWGYIDTQEGKRLNVGYANLGLVPQAMLVGHLMFVGINECLACYDVSRCAMHFFYRMPFVFHEFVAIDNLLIIRDEIGFVGISLDGDEIWKFVTDGVIENYEMTSSKIKGWTTDGSSFSYQIPTTRRQP